MSNIVFRRINGRIVPIKLSKKQKDATKEAAKGAGYTAAGVGVGVATGSAAAGITKFSYESTVASRSMYKSGKSAIDSIKHGQMHFNDVGVIKSGAKVMRQAIAKRFVASKVFKLRNPLLAVGSLVAGGLIAKGVEHTARAINPQHKPEQKENAIGQSAGAVVTTAAYYKKLPVKGVFKVAVNTMARLRGKPRPFQASWF